MKREFRFPEPPRGFPLRRSIRTFLRASHISAAGILFGACIFLQPESVTHPWRTFTLVTGLLLFATDVHATFAVLFEWRG